MPGLLVAAERHLRIGDPVDLADAVTRSHLDDGRCVGWYGPPTPGWRVAIDAERANAPVPRRWPAVSACRTSGHGGPAPSAAASWPTCRWRPGGGATVWVRRPTDRQSGEPSGWPTWWSPSASHPPQLPCRWRDSVSRWPGSRSRSRPGPDACL
ncbi:hypothetical protein NKG94_20190 [Micromonospora sp. M12]